MCSMRVEYDKIIPANETWHIRDVIHSIKTQTKFTYFINLKEIRTIVLVKFVKNRSMGHVLT